MEFCKKFTAVAEVNVTENRILMRKAQNSLFQKSTIYVYQVRLHWQAYIDPHTQTHRSFVVPDDVSLLTRAEAYVVHDVNAFCEV